MVRLKLTDVLSGATGAEALSAQNGPSGRRLEGDSIGFPALIARNLEALALAAPASRIRAEICAARITARLATFRLAQVAFPVIILFTLCESKCCAAFGAGDFLVWHDRFSQKALARQPQSFHLYRSAGALTVLPLVLPDLDSGLRAAHPERRPAQKRD